MIENLIKKLRSYIENEDRYIEEGFKDGESTLISENVYQMFELGQKRTGKSIIPTYSARYRKIKEKKGQRTDHVTLRDTGDFHRSIKVKYFGEGLELVAEDRKTPWLTKRYGDDILGLKDEAVESIVKEYVMPHLLEKIKSHL